MPPLLCLLEIVRLEKPGMYWDVLVLLEKIMYCKINWEKALFQQCTWKCTGIFIFEYVIESKDVFKAFLGISEIQNSKIYLTMVKSYPNPIYLYSCTALYLALVFYYVLGCTEIGKNVCRPSCFGILINTDDSQCAFRRPMSR